MQRFTAVRKVVVALAILTLILLLAACPPHKSIAEIQRDPGRYSNREVSIAGTVMSSWGALGTGMYEISDGTGSMWVFSNGYGVPGKGARIGVAGYVQPTFAFGGRNFSSVLKETRRRH